MSLILRIILSGCVQLSGILFGKQKIGRSYDFNNQDTINFIEYLYKTENVQGLRCSKSDKYENLRPKIKSC